MKERLKEIRRVLGLKQREIAERLDMDVGTVGKWEVGLQRIPKTRIYQICNEFGISREWFETGAGEMFAANDLTPESALRDAAYELFAELSPRGQAAVMAALRARIDSGGECSVPGGSPPTNGATVKTISINNGTVEGDVNLS